jgi:transposase
MRSRIVLAAADGLGNTAIAEQMQIAVSSARKWRSRFVAQRLDGLLDEPRPGRPRTVSDEQVEAVITTTLESTPADATHWSTRSLAVRLGLPQSAVSRIWRAFGLQPHRQEAWKLSRDPLFVDKVRDVVGLYLDPPERAVVLCVDEKEPAPGAGPHRAVHVVLDNASTHKTPAVKRWLTAHPRFTLHFTPTSASWLNLVERWFGELTTKKLQAAPTARYEPSTPTRGVDTAVGAYQDDLPWGTA